MVTWLWRLFPPLCFVDAAVTISTLSYVVRILIYSGTVIPLCVHVFPWDHMYLFCVLWVSLTIREVLEI